MDAHLVLERSPSTTGLAEVFARRWAEDGYLVVRGVLSRAFLAGVERTMRASLEERRTDFRKHVGIELDDGAAMSRLMDGSAEADAWYLGVPRDLQHLVRGEFPLEVRTHPAVAAIARETRLTRLVAGLLGTSDLRLHWPPMLRFKMPGVAQSMVPLHQDAPYFPHLPMFVNVWCPLTEVDARCGGLTVLEGSHRLGPLPHREAVLWGYSLDPGPLHGRFTERRIDIAPGDVLIFGPHLLHRTVSNTSDRIRLSIDSRWFDDSHPATRQYLDVRSGRVVRAF